ncbi:MAG: DUF72 domain-containing protein [Candidatus Bipolaricaulota bacterium]|nr:DUF72 domain-containing protein [Candidatus Bipolaricaulota bacterium]
MTSSIHIGTSGWHYDHWKGPFYPENLPHREMLRYYADRFHTVELNNTFYQLPQEKTLAQWQDTVPGGFIFSVKASRYITHMKKLKDPHQSVAPLLERTEALKDKLGPFLFQLPPRWSINTARLDSFLDSLPKDLSCTFEFRDPSWFDSRTYRILERHGAAFCIYQLAGRLSPREITADHVYVRLHGPGEAYQGKYDEETLSQWAETFLAWADEGREVYCYFDNDEAGYAAQNAVRLQEIVE